MLVTVVLVSTLDPVSKSEHDTIQAQELRVKLPLEAIQRRSLLRVLN